VCFFLHSVVTEEAQGPDNHCNPLYNHQVSFEHSRKVVNLETKYSRIARTQVKEIIHNWIWRNTVDSQSHIAIVLVFKRLDEWLLGCCYWFCCVFLAFEKTYVLSIMRM